MTTAPLTPAAPLARDADAPVARPSVGVAAKPGAAARAGGLAPAVSVDRVSYRYGDRLALDAVSLDVAPGSVVGLLGPNGSGKSTLFRILCTARQPAEGTVALFGQNPLASRAATLDARRRTGVVFQSPALDKELTARENLLHHGHLYGLRGSDLARRIGLALEQADLSDRRDDRVKTFSGGMRRRLELAKAVLHGPDLLLLDEPSTGLDPAARLDWWRVLQTLRDQTGLTAILTTHLLDEAEKCDRLAVLDRGKLLADDTPAALRGRVGGEVVRLSGPDLPALQRALSAEGVASSVVDGELRVERPDGRALLGRWVASHADLIASAAVSRPTLEDAFVTLTGRRFEVEAEPTPARTGKSTGKR